MIWRRTKHTSAPHIAFSRETPAHLNAHLSSHINAGSPKHNCPALSCPSGVFCLTWDLKWVVLILPMEHSCGLQGLVLSISISFTPLLCGKIRHTNLSNPFLIRLSFRSCYTAQLGFTYSVVTLLHDEFFS